MRGFSDEHHFRPSLPLISLTMGIIANLVENRWLIAWTAVAIYLFTKIYAYRRLSAFKGPFSTGFSNFLQSKWFINGKFHLRHKEVIEKYGTHASTLQ